MRKALIVLIIIGFVLSCKLIDRVEQQTGEVIISLDLSQVKVDSVLNKEALNITNSSVIDEVQLVVYEISGKYSTIVDKYIGMGEIESSYLRSDFYNYWIKGVESELDGISSNKCSLYDQYDLSITNNTASGTYELAHGIKYFLAGLFRDNKLQYTGFSDLIDLKVEETKEVSISLYRIQTKPTASFKISPSSGTKNTTFTFDASNSADNEDTPEKLQVQWDWNNNGYWDTNWTTNKTATQKFSSGGVHRIALKVKETDGMTTTTTKTLNISQTRPTASFTISPPWGSPSTLFLFDASNSSDNEDAVGDLQVRWDWDDNGSWDTNWTTDKTEYHQFSTEGTHRVALEVMDRDEMRNTTTKTVEVGPNPVTDIDGNVYKTVRIGTQVWMAENLKVTHYRNGDALSNITGDEEWTNLSAGAYCSVYGNNSNTDTYGLLYNWFAVNDVRNLAPEGWHVPSDEEWKVLEQYLGMSVSEVNEIGIRGTDEGGKLKETGTNHWGSLNTGATNESGFTAIPAGFREGLYGVYYGGINYGSYTVNGMWWTSVSNWYRGLCSNNSGIHRSELGWGSESGLSVRCIKD